MNETKTDLEQRVDKLREPFKAFVGAQATASGLLLAALVAALLLANSPWADGYAELRHYQFGLVLAGEPISWSLLHLVNDGLIALFFFVIGLEVKRELLAGELQEAGRVRLLLGAALGGMLVPASVYLLFNVGPADGQPNGWGIPMATDTAIAIGILAALGSRVPKSVTAFLVGVAIIDDIGAILVIALVYTERLVWPALGAAAALLVVLMAFNQAGLRHPLLYILGGIALWVAIVQSGVHASIAGVVVAATVPARPRLQPGALWRRIRGEAAKVPPEAEPRDVLGQADTHRQINKVERIAQAGTTPLRRWEDGMGPPVALLVLPSFVFLNAGIPITGAALYDAVSQPVALGILFGLVLGKPVGILACVWLGERLGLAVRPEALSYRRLLGVGLLAGVGFTMSTFIGNLALGAVPETLETAKLAIVVASGIAATAGYLSLRFAARAD